MDPKWVIAAIVFVVVLPCTIAFNFVFRGLCYSLNALLGRDAIVAFGNIYGTVYFGILCVASSKGMDPLELIQDSYAAGYFFLQVGSAVSFATYLLVFLVTFLRGGVGWNALRLVSVMLLGIDYYLMIWHTAMHDKPPAMKKAKMHYFVYSGVFCANFVLQRMQQQRMKQEIETAGKIG